MPELDFDNKTKEELEAIAAEEEAQAEEAQKEADAAVAKAAKEAEEAAAAKAAAEAALAKKAAAAVGAPVNSPTPSTSPNEADRLRRWRSNRIAIGVSPNSPMPDSWV